MFRWFNLEFGSGEYIICTRTIIRFFAERFVANIVCTGLANPQRYGFSDGYHYLDANGDLCHGIAWQPVDKICP